MRFKKALAILLALSVIAGSFAACGGEETIIIPNAFFDDEEGGEGGGGGGESSEVHPPYKVQCQKIVG
ncbi:MAG: hypothetical protein IKS11_00610, partial [Lachnospiraceae bacterium]|nr:hypothetical protein [Lachnospiraceae bacterium]